MLNDANMTKDGAELAETIRRAEAAERASRAKSEFLAVMSHEMRTPLSSITGAAYLLGRAPELSPQSRKLVETLKAGADSLLALLNDFLDISKIEAGRLALEAAPFRLSDMLRPVETLIKARLNGDAVRLRVDCVEPAQRLPVGDARRLQQVVMNLAANAVKFTSHGEIGIAAVLTATDDRSGVLHLSVSDTGVGIAPERLTDVFEPYTQIHGAGATRQDGTGLGLSIVRHLVDAMQGQMRVESAPGVGTSFAITIPVQMTPDRAG
jgi:signal transduction histidine kinase